MSAQPGKIDRWTPRSRRAGGYRADVKQQAARRRRRLDRAVERGDERAEGARVTRGWAD